MKTALTLSLLAILPNAAAAQTQWGSVYTNVKKECVVAQQSNEKSEIDFYEADCKSYGGYRLKVSGGDLRYAPVLSFNGEDLSMDRLYRFHDLASENVEWVYKRTAEADGSGELSWKGFIYRLSVASDESDRDEKVLYAVRLNGRDSCLLGRVRTNQEALALVKNETAPCVAQEE